MYRKVHAVIIGIDRYPNLPAAKQLGYAVSDAKALEQCLRSRFAVDEVLTLYNEDATREKIISLVNGPLSRTHKEDAVLFFFAGHAGQLAAPHGGAIGYLVPHNGGHADSPQNISMAVIRDDWCRRIPAKHIFFIIDACFSGLLLKTRGGTYDRLSEIEYLKTVTAERSVQVLAAGSSGQEALDIGPGGHSVFTNRLLEALNGVDDFIAASTLGNALPNLVFSDAQALNKTQLPQYGRLVGEGDFILIASSMLRPASVAAEIAQLKAEVAKLDQQIADAAEASRNEEQWQLQLQIDRSQALLRAKQTEEQRLIEQEEARWREEQQRQLELEDQKRRESEEQARLAELKRIADERREQLEETQALSLEGRLSQIRELDQAIVEIRDRYREELRQQLLAVLDSHRRSWAAEPKERDEFETTAEYWARIRNASGGDPDENARVFSTIFESIQREYSQTVNPLLYRINEVGLVEHRPAALRIEIGDYDPDNEKFPIYLHYNDKRDNLTYPIIRSDLEVNREKSREFKGRVVAGLVTATASSQLLPSGRVIPYIVVIDDCSHHCMSSIRLSYQDRENLSTALMHLRERQIHYSFQCKISKRQELKTCSSIYECERKFFVHELHRYRFINNDKLELGKGILFDSSNSVIWSKTSLLTARSIDNIEQSYCDQFEHEGIPGWRIPTKIEIDSMHLIPIKGEMLMGNYCFAANNSQISSVKANYGRWWFGSNDPYHILCIK
jgi:uncharacterized caspase-like protein